MELAEKKCLACSGELPKLSDVEIEKLLKEVDGWQIDGDQHLFKSFKKKNFQEALDLANQVGLVAEEEGHHPDLLVRWGELKITIWTHEVSALTESDFIVAAKIDKVSKAQ
jgi:4a-hydroxytetrahydrobiopterin dehydratase